MPEEAAASGLPRTNLKNNDGPNPRSNSPYNIQDSASTLEMSKKFENVQMPQQASSPGHNEDFGVQCHSSTHPSQTSDNSGGGEFPSKVDSESCCPEAKDQLQQMSGSPVIGGQGCHETKILPVEGVAAEIFRGTGQKDAVRPQFKNTHFHRRSSVTEITETTSLPSRPKELSQSDQPEAPCRPRQNSAPPSLPYSLSGPAKDQIPSQGFSNMDTSPTLASQQSGPLQLIQWPPSQQPVTLRTRPYPLHSSSQVDFYERPASRPLDSRPFSASSHAAPPLLFLSQRDRRHSSAAQQPVVLQMAPRWSSTPSTPSAALQSTFEQLVSLPSVMPRRGWGYGRWRAVEPVRRPVPVGPLAPQLSSAPTYPAAAAPQPVHMKWLNSASLSVPQVDAAWSSVDNFASQTAVHQQTEQNVQQKLQNPTLNVQNSALHTLQQRTALVDTFAHMTTTHPYGSRDIRSAGAFNLSSTSSGARQSSPTETKRSHSLLMSSQANLDTVAIPPLKSPMFSSGSPTEQPSIAHHVSPTRSMIESAPSTTLPNATTDDSTISNESFGELPGPSFDDSRPPWKERATRDIPQMEDDVTKPPYSYAALIGLAILHAPSKQLSFSQICSWVSETFSYYRRSDQNWQRHLGHELSVNKAFIKLERPTGDRGKGSYWRIEPGLEEQFLLDKLLHRATIPSLPLPAASQYDSPDVWTSDMSMPSYSAAPPITSTNSGPSTMSSADRYSQSSHISWPHQSSKNYPSEKSDSSAAVPPMHSSASEFGHAPWPDSVIRDPTSATNLAAYSYGPLTPEAGQKFTMSNPSIPRSIEAMKALKIAACDPRTIARDVLRAAGRHPTEPPLNYHMFIKIRDYFSFATGKPNMETFRWDLMDPGNSVRPLNPVQLDRAQASRDQAAWASAQSPNTSTNRSRNIFAKSTSRERTFEAISAPRNSSVLAPDTRPPALFEPQHSTLKQNFVGGAETAVDALTKYTPQRKIPTPEYLSKQGSFEVVSTSTNPSVITPPTRPSTLAQNHSTSNQSVGGAEAAVDALGTDNHSHTIVCVPGSVSKKRPFQVISTSTESSTIPDSRSSTPSERNSTSKRIARGTEPVTHVPTADTSRQGSNPPPKSTSETRSPEPVSRLTQNSVDAVEKGLSASSEALVPPSGGITEVVAAINDDSKERNIPTSDTAKKTISTKRPFEATSIVTVSSTSSPISQSPAPPNNPGPPSKRIARGAPTVGNASTQNQHPSRPTASKSASNKRSFEAIAVSISRSPTLAQAAASTPSSTPARITRSSASAAELDPKSRRSAQRAAVVVKGSRTRSPHQSRDTASKSISKKRLSTAASRSASYSAIPSAVRSQSPTKSTIEVAIPTVNFELPSRGPFPVFRCGWKQCSAELHNLETLRRHVWKAHVSYSMLCGWRGCSMQASMSASDLYKHAKATHTDPVAWKLGDGPSVPRIDRASDQIPDEPRPPTVTPDINQNSGVEDALSFPAADKAIRAFNRLRGNQTNEAKATEVLRAVERLKERIGVGLDVGGCKLATPGRIANVSNDEGVYQVLKSEPGL